MKRLGEGVVLYEVLHPSSHRTSTLFYRIVRLKEFTNNFSTIAKIIFCEDWTVKFSTKILEREAVPQQRDLKGSQGSRSTRKITGKL